MIQYFEYSKTSEFYILLQRKKIEMIKEQRIIQLQTLTHVWSVSAVVILTIIYNQNHTFLVHILGNEGYKLIFFKESFWIVDKFLPWLSRCLGNNQNVFNYSFCDFPWHRDSSFCQRLKTQNTRYREFRNETDEINSFWIEREVYVLKVKKYLMFLDITF